MPVGKRVGRSDDLSRLAAEEKLGLSEAEIDEIMSPASYIGRCPQQVDAFLEQVRPLLAGTQKRGARLDL